MLRLYVTMWMFNFVVWEALMAIILAFSLALRMFW